MSAISPHVNAARTFSPLTHEKVRTFICIALICQSSQWLLNPILIAVPFSLRKACLSLCGYRWFSIILALGVITHSIPGQHSNLPTGVTAMGVAAESVLQLLWTLGALKWLVG